MENLIPWTDTEDWPEWFHNAILTGYSRLIAARLRFPPASDEELEVTFETWCEVLWGSPFKWNTTHGLNIIAAFRMMINELKDWPQPTDFWPCFEEVCRSEEHQRQRDLPRLPAPEKSLAERQEIRRVGTQKVKDAIAAVEDKHRSKVVAPIRELLKASVAHHQEE